ncbi:hypothetical protein H0E84_16780 [Luteimonas sp. SJ-92]|uniref:Transmembrane repetitive protein n=1 Tax=Luteimonas salinisoli TaxID=2752307 RepID=A0A853JGP2_9GAMM|nr:hypothetical protein [Luteimonas salinisoli]NZA28035.1 hypothetical protein [Luteimonas salinisoli]
MFTSAELIEALRRRLRRSIRPQAPGRFPPGWQAWFDAMPVEAGAVTGASPAAVVAVVLGREPPVPAVWVHLNRWQAFGALWRQQWHPASTDERWMRVSATTLSLLLHIVFSALLLWLMYARFLQVAAPAQRGEDTVVEVEFIGEGTPEDAGAGAPQRAAQAAEGAEPAAAPEELPQPAPEAVLPPPSVPREAQLEPEPAPQSQEQPLQVTETAQPDLRFVVPPPRTADLAQPRVDMPDVPVRSRDIEVVEIREPPVPQVRPLPQAPVEVPDLEQPAVELVEREIAAPLPRPRAAQVRTPAIAAPELRAEAPQLQAREIPLRLPAGAQAGEQIEPTAEAGAAPDRGEGSTDAPAAAETAGGTRPEALASGSGEAATPDAGAWETPRRGDDWGESARQRPGGQQGSSSLFNPDGSPRLAEGNAPVGGGLPPGTITEDYEKIDRMGTWLKRPPTDYEPTSFDRFWVPHESLLEEWVRRSVRTVLIPIPGTGKSIRCDVVTLALAGGCSITDPNMQDVEAEARPPPDVPFKRELFEDQDSLGD